MRSIATIDVARGEVRDQLEHLLFRCADLDRSLTLAVIRLEIGR
jgi:hypothetical protein